MIILWFLGVCLFDSIILIFNFWFILYDGLLFFIICIEGCLNKYGNNFCIFLGCFVEVEGGLWLSLKLFCNIEGSVGVWLIWFVWIGLYIDLFFIVFFLVVEIFWLLVFVEIVMFLRNVLIIKFFCKFKFRWLMKKCKYSC